MKKEILNNYYTSVSFCLHGQFAISKN